MQKDSADRIQAAKFARIATDLAFDDLLLVDRTKEIVHLRAKMTRSKRSLLGDANAC